jgi:hypothetical protein
MNHVCGDCSADYNPGQPACPVCGTTQTRSQQLIQTGKARLQVLRGAPAPRDEGPTPLPGWLEAQGLARHSYHGIVGSDEH